MSSDPLKPLRDKVDAIDVEILDALGKRFNVVREIGQMKKAAGDDVEVPSREKNVRDHWLSLARNRNLPTEMVGKLVEIVLKYAKQEE